MPDAFIEAVIANDSHTVRAALARGRDPNLPDQYGWIALHRAAANNSAEVAMLLLDAGSSITATGTEEWTPLHLAAVSGSSRMVKVLVDAGAPIDAPSCYGDTPLHLCYEVSSARILLQAGADPDRLNHKGLSPWMKAEKYGDTEVAAFIKSWPDKRK